MGNNIVLKHKESGLIKEAKVGFSWTNLFFGIFVPLFRGDWKGLLIQLGFGIITRGISWLVFPFIYNRLYVSDLIKKGFKPVGPTSKKLLQQKNLI